MFFNNAIVERKSKAMAMAFGAEKPCPITIANMAMWECVMYDSTATACWLVSHGRSSREEQTKAKWKWSPDSSHLVCGQTSMSSLTPSRTSAASLPCYDLDLVAYSPRVCALASSWDSRTDVLVGATGSQALR